MAVRERFFLNLISFFMGVASLGCAGPMSPFGAFSLFKNKSSSNEILTGQTKRAARVRFTPERQVLHTSSTFSVIIEDPEGVPEDFRFSVKYNGLDVTKEFLSHAVVQSLDPLNQQIKLTTKNLRLLAARDNFLTVSYWRKSETQPVTAQYLPPVCSAYTSGRTVLTVPEFEPSMAILQMINLHATSKKLNPYFVAALVAQESSFDSQALSMSKALGLTQVTAGGEGEVIKHFQDWPRYPGVSEMPLPLLKLAIMGGRIHAGNEWRLDPSLSIQGGVEYLAYINEYWNRPEKRAQVQRSLGPSDSALSEVVLASYNSGAARVSEALDRSGPGYLKDEQLGEANKYVRRVVSYCDHFENQEER